MRRRREEVKWSRKKVEFFARSSGSIADRVPTNYQFEKRTERSLIRNLTHIYFYQTCNYLALLTATLQDLTNQKRRLVITADVCVSYKVIFISQQPRTSNSHDLRVLECLPVD